MGFFDFFKKRSVRYAAIIGIIGTIAVAEVNYNSKKEADQISTLGAKIEHSLKEGQVNKKI